MTTNHSLSPAENTFTRRDFLRTGTTAVAASAAGTLVEAASLAPGARGVGANVEWRNKQMGMAYRKLGRTGIMISEVVSGGDVDQASVVSEQWLTDMGGKALLEVLNHPKSQERIMGMMQTGKPVRN